MKHSNPAKIAIFALVSAFACLLAAYIWNSTHRMVACERHNEVIDRTNPKYQIVRVDTACDGIASSYDVSISVVDGASNHTLIFEYGDGSSFVKTSTESEPVVRWINDRTIMVEVGTVGYIRLMVRKVGPLTIEYKIGNVMFKS